MTSGGIGPGVISSGRGDSVVKRREWDCDLWATRHSFEQKVPGRRVDSSERGRDMSFSM